MARNSTVSIEQVADAAAQIQKLGMTPTSRNIREVVGGGSMGTILKHFQAWQSGALQPKKVISESLDASIVQSINSHIAQQIQESRMDLTTQLAEKEADANMLLQEYSKLSDDMTSQSSVLSALQLQHAELSGRFHQLELENKNLQADLLNERQSNERVKIELATADKNTHRVDSAN